MQYRRQQSHHRILDVASRALCRHGHAGVGVASVMKEAGLTHGGFYAHFASRDAMLAAAVDYAWTQSALRLREKMQTRMAGGDSPLHALVEEYLSGAHADMVDAGCPVAALAGEMPRMDAGSHDASCKRMLDLTALAREALPPGSPPGAEFVITSTMIGALQMARALDEAQRDAILRACRQALISRYDRATTIA